VNARPLNGETGAPTRLQRTLDALNSPVRREILWLTRDREASAGEIAGHFQLAGPTISEHLRVLRQAHLVTQRRVGTSRLYQANPVALRAIRPLVQEAGSKWILADGVAERSLVKAQMRPAVVSSVVVPLTVEAAFASFATGEGFSAWLGVPVTIDDQGHFATTLEWGTEVRGLYEIVVPPALIALRWDFEDRALPIPGAERSAYLRFFQADGGTEVRVQQWLETEEQAQFLAGAWQMVLGRLAAHAHGLAPPSRRPRRPKLNALT
jgi:DNA-binding transcriptional ArsR family regulator/uncharacterized protein YndB with AHSA1/START domain